MTTLKLRTVGTVSSLWREAVSKFGKEKQAPMIRFSGLWLQDNGFDIGKKFEIHVGNRRLLLAIKSTKDLKNPKESVDVYMVKDSSIT